MAVESNMAIHIDHRNRNGLINLKANLRLCTNAENGRNRKKNRNNTSGYKGVFKFRDRWLARIGVDMKSVHLGVFKDKKEAALAYNEAAIKYHGKFALINEGI